VDSGVIRQIVTAALGGTAAYVMIGQVRKPSGWPGRFVAWTMNRSHSRLTSWGLGHVEVRPRFTVLDVGCGGGRTIERLAGMASQGKVYGIDYSAASVATARATNAELIRAGRVDVQQGSVSALPYPDQTFDLVTAVETHYYWPDLVADTREVLRVLKPGGTFVIIGEAYRAGAGPMALAMKLIRAKYLTLDEHKAILTQAGYAGIQLFPDTRLGWICAVAKRPA